MKKIKNTNTPTVIYKHFTGDPLQWCDPQHYDVTQWCEFIVCMRVCVGHSRSCVTQHGQLRGLPIGSRHRMLDQPQIPSMSQGCETQSAQSQVGAHPLVLANGHQNVHCFQPIKECLLILIQKICR